MTEYFKNANVYELKNRHISSAFGAGNMTQFWYK